MTEQEKRQRRCCFAGHRAEAIPLSEADIRAWLREQIQSAISAGFVTFITGMGMGVDIWAAQEVLHLRATNPTLHLIAVEPYPSFSAKWSEEWQAAYRDVLHGADLVKHLSTHYSPNASEFRGRWLVDHSARLIAIYNGSEGYTGSITMASFTPSTSGKPMITVHRIDIDHRPTQKVGMNLKTQIETVMRETAKGTPALTIAVKRGFSLAYRCSYIWSSAVLSDV